MTRLSHRLIGRWPMPKLLAIFVFSLLFGALYFPSPARASYLDIQGQDPTATFKAALESNSMNYTQFSLNSLDQITMGLTKKLVNYPILAGETQDTSLINAAGRAVGYLYLNQPSSIDYLAYEASRLHLVPHAYAATGSGWGWLSTTPSPILKIWTISRNVCYLFFVVLFVVIGFMIMFRSKLNPQTVINVQLALPRVIIALIMVTFSYAISGFIVDVVFLGHGLIRNIITEPGDVSCPAETSTKEGWIFGDSTVRWEQSCEPDSNMRTPSAWPLHILGKYGGTANSIAQQFLDGMGLIMRGAFEGIFGGGDANQAIAGLFGLIIAFSVIGATFKIFFTLLSKYVMIIILVISMPFSFLGSALSAQSSPIKPLKALLANTISFPLVSLLLSLAYYFSSGVHITSDLPPFYFGAYLGEKWGGNISASLIAIGILMAIPTILSSIDKMFETQSIAQGSAEQIAGKFSGLPIIGGLMR